MNIDLSLIGFENAWKQKHFTTLPIAFKLLDQAVGFAVLFAQVIGQSLNFASLE